MGGISKGSDLYLSLLSIPIIIFFGGLEELGWRYIPSTIFRKRIFLWNCNFIYSFIWAVWHLPLFFIKGTVNSSLNFGLFTIMIFGMSFALAAIYYTSKSIWLCILFHTMINALSGSWIIEDNILIKKLLQQ